jgi:hypothetical protein
LSALRQHRTFNVRIGCFAGLCDNTSYHPCITGPARFALDYNCPILIRRRRRDRESR